MICLIKCFQTRDSQARRGIVATSLVGMPSSRFVRETTYSKAASGEALHAIKRLRTRARRRVRRPRATPAESPSVTQEFGALRIDPSTQEEPPQKELDEQRTLRGHQSPPLLRVTPPTLFASKQGREGPESSSSRKNPRRYRRWEWLPTTQFLRDLREWPCFTFGIVMGRCRHAGMKINGSVGTEVDMECEEETSGAWLSPDQQVFTAPGACQATSNIPDRVTTVVEDSMARGVANSIDSSVQKSVEKLAFQHGSRSQRSKASRKVRGKKTIGGHSNVGEAQWSSGFSKQSISFDQSQINYRVRTNLSSHRMELKKKIEDGSSGSFQSVDKPVDFAVDKTVYKGSSRNDRVSVRESREEPSTSLFADRLSEHEQEHMSTQSTGKTANITRCFVFTASGFGIRGKSLQSRIRTVGRPGRRKWKHHQVSSTPPKYCHYRPKVVHSGVQECSLVETEVKQDSDISEVAGAGYETKANLQPEELGDGKCSSSGSIPSNSQEATEHTSRLEENQAEDALDALQEQNGENASTALMESASYRQSKIDPSSQTRKFSPKLAQMNIDLSVVEAHDAEILALHDISGFQFETLNEKPDTICNAKKPRKRIVRKERKITRCSMGSSPTVLCEHASNRSGYPTLNDSEKLRIERITQAQEIGNRLKDLANFNFKSGDYSTAESLYSTGINAAKQCKESEMKPLVALLLSNRAAARLMLKSPTRAFEDCQEAMHIYPKYIKAHIRGSNCLIQLGEFHQAVSVLEHAAEMLSSDDRHYAKVIETASEARSFISSLKDLEHYLSRNSFTNVKIPDIIMKARSLAMGAVHSEEVQRILVSVLLRSGMYDEVVKQVKRTRQELHAEQLGHLATIWWQWMLTQAYWQKQGELDASMKETETLVALMRQHEVERLECSLNTGCMISLDEIREFIQNINEAGKLKEKGNDEVRSGKYDRAVETYTKSLSIAGQCGAPAHLVAIYYYNRGSAYYGLKKYVEAIGDCCWARALSKGKTENTGISLY